MNCVVFQTININRSTENILCIDMNSDIDAEQQQVCTSEAIRTVEMSSVCCSYQRNLIINTNNSSPVIYSTKFLFFKTILLNTAASDFHFMFNINI